MYIELISDDVNHAATISNGTITSKYNTRANYNQLTFDPFFVNIFLKYPTELRIVCPRKKWKTSFRMAIKIRIIDS